MMVVGALCSAATARAQLRYCERLGDACWSCADVEAGFSVPCADGACADGQLCVVREETPECHAATTLCCEAGACEIPPGCEGAASACTTPTDPADPETCTFLSACPPFPMIDAGVSLDAGTAMPDAGETRIDAGAIDGGDVMPTRDAGTARIDASRDAVPPSFAGGGGFLCSAAQGPRTSAWLVLAVMASAIAARGCRRRTPPR